jgi:hypothetical protein
VEEVASVSAPVPGSVAVYAVAWRDRYNGPNPADASQGAGWITPSGDFIPARRVDSDGDEGSTPARRLRRPQAGG